MKALLLLPLLFAGCIDSLEWKEDFPWCPDSHLSHHEENFGSEESRKAVVDMFHARGWTNIRLVKPLGSWTSGLGRCDILD